MSAKIQLILAPTDAKGTAKGLSDDERLDLGRLMLKAGNRVEIVRRRPVEKPGIPYSYFMILDRED